MDNIKKLDAKLSYKSMFLFLVKQYEKNKSDDIGAYLGDLMLFPSGGTVDPAAEHDWLDAVEQATGNRNIEYMDMNQVFKATILLLEGYYSRTTGDDIAKLLNICKLDESGNIIDSEIRSDWSQAINSASSPESDELITLKIKKRGKS